MRKLIAVFAVVAVPLLVSAQWPVSRSSGVPRTADGGPDLTAPAPRAPDGKPDLSGLWDNGRNTNIPQRGARGADLNAAPGGNRGARGTAPATNAGVAS